MRPAALRREVPIDLDSSVAVLVDVEDRARPTTQLTSPSVPPEEAAECRGRTANVIERCER